MKMSNYNCSYASITEYVGEDVLGGDEPSEENELSFFLSLIDPLFWPFLTERYPDVLTSSGILRLFDVQTLTF